MGDHKGKHVIRKECNCVSYKAQRSPDKESDLTIRTLEGDEKHFGNLKGMYTLLFTVDQRGYQNNVRLLPSIVIMSPRRTMRTVEYATICIEPLQSPPR